MVDYRSPALQAPPRKPVPGGHAGLQFQSSDAPSPHYSPQQKQKQQPQPQPQPQQPSNPPPQRSEQPPRTSSSSYAQNSVQQQQQQPTKQQPMNRAPSHAAAHQAQQQYRPNVPSRNPSTATSSTTSMGGNGFPGRHPSNAYSDVRRSSSSGSANTQNGYVASMRRQRATVWSDRAQTEDPRVLAQRRAAKQRAMQEVQGGASGRSSTLLSTGKIRHNATARTMNYNTGTMVGAGVPLRLSANEIGGADDELDQRPGTAPHRGGAGPGSERGSTGSGVPSGGAGNYQQPPQTRFSSGSSSTHTAPNVDAAEKRPDIPEIVETPVDLNGDDEWLHHEPTPAQVSSSSSSGITVGKLRLHNADEQDHAVTTNSDVSEQEDSFGQPTELAAPTGATAMASQQKKMTDDLKRRGSVDDRSSNMAGVKLFIANPDLSD